MCYGPEARVDGGIRRGWQSLHFRSPLSLRFVYSLPNVPPSAPCRRAVVTRPSCLSCTKLFPQRVTSTSSLLRSLNTSIRSLETPDTLATRSIWLSQKAQNAGKSIPSTFRNRFVFPVGHRVIVLASGQLS